ncbi:hypothetical protein SAMN05192550_3253 [Flavobacterium glycines]|uniref:Secreted protein n=2 Tax=Flavobacterium glycines TaxID=551990 RepID=A0A1B9DTZ2_9FLAO|nr:hypothetical protein [Flavobacterium glycines]OCB73144.1 hypothetical protein FBGL_03645 [Flavobacterium glycines]GEL12315.1 hypothetical protein FGL01_30540 [Flavobacterium glycines]SDK06148.1 hypothetical protein SAMN05192550_3253 [Flavobacterium glycines]
MMNQYFSFKGQFLVLAFIFGAFSTAFSQEEFGSEFKVKAAPVKKKKEAAPVKDVKFNSKDYEKIKAYEVAGLDKNNYVVPKPEEKDAEKLAKRDQDLGVVKTTSGTAKVRYRDAAYVDGDKIRVYLNYEIVEQEVLLSGDAQGFDITLKKGVNRIDFEAINDGFAAPNTAEFKIFNDKGEVISSNQWNIAQGYKATIVIEKE